MQGTWRSELQGACVQAAGEAAGFLIRAFRFTSHTFDVISRCEPYNKLLLILIRKSIQL